VSGGGCKGTMHGFLDLIMWTEGMLKECACTHSFLCIMELRSCRCECGGGQGLRKPNRKGVAGEC
jgi:hypothetical protein